MATIGIAHFPTQGHVGPAMRLSRILVERGHRVLALAPESYRGEADRVGASLIPLGEVPPPPSGQPMKDGNIWDMTAAVAQITAGLIPPAIEILHDERADLVISDAQAPWGRVAAEWLGLPHACSWPLYPPKTVVVTDANRPAKPSVAALSAVEDARQRIGREWGVALGNHGTALSSMGELNLVYTTREVVEGDTAPLDDSWRFIGPLLGGPAAAAPSSGDGPPLVYVALGTVYGGNASVFRAVLDALAEEPVRVLVATWGHLAAEALEPVPGNAEVAGRVDSLEVLRRAAVHVTHGGAGSAQESVVAGVPMLFLPQGSDNAAWAERFVALGVGERPAGDSPDEIRAGVRRLLADGAMHERTLALGRRLGAPDGAAAAVEAVESLLAA
jgi:MGT family glycosyltransferase